MNVRSREYARMRINEEWHRGHPMPKNPSVDQRIAWHVAHEKHCQCRPMPEKLKQLIAAREKSGGDSGAR